MRQRRLLTAAVGAAAATTLMTAAPAEAMTIGGGPVVGTVVCANAQATITIDSPAVVIDDIVGELHVTGSTYCTAGIGSGGGFGTLTIPAPGLSCSEFGTGWTWIAPHFQLIGGGTCSFDGGPVENWQIVVEGAKATD